MFTSPTAWEDLYGHHPNSTDRATHGPPPPRHSTQQLADEQADPRQRIEENNSCTIGRHSNAGAFLYGRPSSATEFGGASGCGQRRDAEPTRGQERFLCPSFSSFVTPRTVTSQPVRVFPPPPTLPVATPVPLWNEAAPPRFPPASNDPVFSNRGGWLSPTADVPHARTMEPQGGGPWFYGVPACNAPPYSGQQESIEGHAAATYADNSNLHDTRSGDLSMHNAPPAPWGTAGAGHSRNVVPAAYPGSVYPSTQRRQLDGGACYQPPVSTDNFYYHDATNHHRNAAYAGEDVNANLHEGDSSYSKASRTAPAPVSNAYSYYAVPLDGCNNGATPTPHERLDLSPETLQCLSISDGARQLNSVRHRSAAAAAGAFHLNSSGPSPASARGSATGVSRSAHARLERRGPLDSTPHPAGADPSPPHSPLSSAAATSASMTAAAAAASGGGGIVQTEPCCVAAIIFNNAKEVGVALCELPSLTISLLQFADTAVFFKTTSLLHSRNPVEVLVPSTVVDTELVQTLLRQHGAHMTFTSVQRCFYHTEAGVQRLSQLKSSEEAALCIEDTDRYLCVAAANALVLYMEHVNDMQLLPGSVRVRAEALEHFMEVTRTTARALQIIADGSGTVGVLSSSASSSHVLTNDDAQDVSQSGQRMDAPSTSRRRPRSARAAAATPSLRSGAVEGTSTTLRAAALVDVVPRACTIMGQRYLRRALLQPLRDRIAVQGRHDTVEWLLRDPRRLHVLRALLRRTAALDLERLTATLTLQPRRERTDAQKQSYLESLLLLWSALPYLERLHTQLRAHLGPPPTDATPTIHFPSSPSTPSDTKEQQQPQQQQSRETDESLSRVKEPVTVASTPVYPSVLHSVATTLHQCRFTELAALMGRYLERSVLPSVVEHNERGRATDLQNAGAEMPFFFEQGRRHGTSASLVNGVAQRRPPPTPRAATTTLLRVLRMCFLVQAPPGGELDALRTRLSQRITGITAYAEELRRRYQLYSLRLEPDPVKLYCFSYLSTEESKAQAVPVTWRYAGGSHFALLLAALRQQQQQQQRLEAHGGVFSENDEDDDEATEEFGDTISRRARQSSARQASSSSAMTGGSLRMLTGQRDNRLAARRAAVTPAYSPTRPPPLAPSWSAEPSLYPTESCGEGSWNALAPCNSQSDGRRGRRHGRRVRCGTEELEYYGARMQECVAAILVQQMRCVQPLVQALRQRFLSALQATVESVALLDTLLSFALYSLTHHCTRPVMVELKTGLTTAASDAHVCETSLSDEEAEVKRRDRDEDPFVVSENPDGSTSLNATATTSPSASPKSTASCSARLASAMMSDDVADTKRKSSQGLAFFIKDAFHPSAGVTGASLGRSNQQSLPRYPGGVATHLQDAPVATPMCVGGGLSLSWGTHGEVCIITGPNACGKTTLLRILGQHITLAQAGCFVPARQARIFLADRLLAHMLCEELPSVLHSSFKRELMELNELTHAATEESMVLMDELGRSTTTAQGFSLAWATALFLGHRHVHAVLTTHFAGLPSLTRVRPGRVVAFHFRVSLAQVEMRTGRKWQQRPPTEEANHAPERASRAARCSLARPRATTAATTAAATPGPRITIARFGHELFPGPCPQRWYGLAMAERLGFFEPVLTMARQTRACHREVSEGAMGAHDAEGDRVKE